MATALSGRWTILLAAAVVAAVPVWMVPLSGQAPSAAPVPGADISLLGSFDYAQRAAAASRLRRLPAAVAAPALQDAVRSHADEYVRFRAFVLLSGVDERAAREAARNSLRDRNDRLRTAVYQWYEHHPEPDVVPLLLDGLAKETSEFVRPAVTRALAAHGGDPRVRDVLLSLVHRGEDMFRGAVIAALGDYRATYAVEALVGVARVEGPLQDDAVTALGQIGGTVAHDAVASLQADAPDEVIPTITAALCLMGTGCGPAETYLSRALDSATARADRPAVSSVAHALGMLAIQGSATAANAMLVNGVRATEPVRELIALAVGAVALRAPQAMLDVLVAAPSAAPAVDLLQEAFDRLTEDFEEERFCSEIRRAYWSAGAGSTRRTIADMLMQRLEF